MARQITQGNRDAGEIERSITKAIANHAARTGGTRSKPPQPRKPRQLRVWQGWVADKAAAVKAAQGRRKAINVQKVYLHGVRPDADGTPECLFEVRYH